MATARDRDLTPEPIDPGVRIGHVHLKVADLEQSWRSSAVFSASS